MRASYGCKKEEIARCLKLAKKGAAAREQKSVRMERKKKMNANATPSYICTPRHFFAGGIDRRRGIRVVLCVGLR